MGVNGYIATAGIHMGGDREGRRVEGGNSIEIGCGVSWIEMRAHGWR